MLKAKVKFVINENQIPYLVDVSDLVVRNIYSHEKIYKLPSEVLLFISGKHERVKTEEKFKEGVG